MKILQRQKRVWIFTCHQCDTVLELDETDFETRKINYVGGSITVEHIATPCPVCGKLWSNVEKSRCATKVIPIDD